MPSLTEKLAWVTGAAGGIGSAVCKALVLEGARVVATDMRALEVAAATRSLVCDVSSRTDVERVARECDAIGGVDVLVNCAGVIMRNDVLEITPQAWDRLFSINVKGAFLCSQAAARSMIAHGRGGAIVNVGSINAEKVFPDTVAYCASKGALHSLTRATALALAKYGIRVNAIAPGAIVDTDLEPARWQRGDERDRMCNLTPLQRLGESADVADAVAFAASEQARFMTGTTLFIDGGRNASV